MTVVRFVLRHEDDVGLFDLGKVLDRTRNDMLSDGKPLSAYDRATGEPWVNEYAERPVC